MNETRPLAVTIIEERTCGWCGVQLKGNEQTPHALHCEKQPYKIYRKALLEELQAELGVRTHWLLPRWVKKAMRNAAERTAEYVTRSGWRYRE